MGISSCHVHALCLVAELQLGIIIICGKHCMQTLLITWCAMHVERKAASLHRVRNIIEKN